MANLTLFNSYAPPTATSIFPSAFASVGALPAPLAHLEGTPTVNECILPDGAKPSEQNTNDYRGFDWGAAACGSAATLLFAVPGTVMLTRNNKSTKSSESQTKDSAPSRRSVEPPHYPCSFPDDSTEHGAVQWVPAQVEPSQEDPSQLFSGASTAQAPVQSYFERVSNLIWGDTTRKMAMEPLKTRYDVKAPVLWQDDPDRLKDTAAFYRTQVPEHVPIALPKQPELYPNTTTIGRSVSFAPDTVWDQMQSPQHQESHQSQYPKDYSQYSGNQSQYQGNQSQSQEDRSQYQDDQNQYREDGEGKSGQDDPRDRDDGWRNSRSWNYTDVLRNRAAVAVSRMLELRRHLDSVGRSTRRERGTTNQWFRGASLRLLDSSKWKSRTRSSVRPPVPDVQLRYRTGPAWSGRGQAQPTARNRHCQPIAPSPARTNTAALPIPPEAQQGIWQPFVSSRADLQHGSLGPSLQTSQNHGGRPVASRHEARSNTTAPQSTSLNLSTYWHLSPTQTTETLEPPVPFTTSLTSGQHTELPIFKGGDWRAAKETQPPASTAPQYRTNVAQGRNLQAPVQQLRQQHADWQQPQRKGDGHLVPQTFARPPSQRGEYPSSFLPAGSEQFAPAQGYQAATLTSSQLNTDQGPESLNRPRLGYGTSTDYTAPRDPSTTSTAPATSWGDTSTAWNSLRSDKRWGPQSLAGSSLLANQTGGNNSTSPQSRPPPQRAVRPPRVGTQSGKLGSIAEEAFSEDPVTVVSQPPSVHQPRPTSTLSPSTAQVFTSPRHPSQFSLVPTRSATPAHNPTSLLGKRRLSRSPWTGNF